VYITTCTTTAAAMIATTLLISFSECVPKRKTLGLLRTQLITHWLIIGSKLVSAYFVREKYRLCYMWKKKSSQYGLQAGDTSSYRCGFPRTCRTPVHVASIKFDFSLGLIRNCLQKTPHEVPMLMYVCSLQHDFVVIA